jgi:streptogramin lyase
MRARIAIGSALVLLLLGGAAAVPAAAHYPSVTEYQTGLSLNNGAWDIVDGEDGKLWFTADALSAFGPLSAGDGLISEFTGLLTVAGKPKGVTRGPDGNLWIAEAGLNGAIARVAKDGTVTEFNTGLTASDPWDITAGPDGNLWFVSQSPAFIGRITPDGTITEFSTGLTPNSQPSAITAGNDGNLWFTESATGRIGRITPDGDITENSIGLTANMVPTDIVSGPDGNLWFTLAGDPGAIGRITPEGVFKQFDHGLTRNARPTGIATGTDGALWFTESASPGRIGRITTSGDITEYAEGLTPDRAPWMIAPGPDGNMWFTENANPGALARIGLPPLVRTRDVGSAFSDNSALLRGKVRPNAQATEFHFEYGQGESLHMQSDSGSAGDGWDYVEVIMRIANLKPEKKYHYRVVATNDSGTSFGDEGYFITAALEPEHGEVVVAEPTGRVRFKPPGGRWRRLAGTGAELPVGTALDTRRGTIRLTSAARNGDKQAGTFGGGVLQVRQPRRARGRVDLYLRGGNFAACTRATAGRRGGRVASAASTRRVRRLWGRDSGGSFRSHGRHSHATVRGTRWLTEDRCDGTLTRVTEGAVVVRDFARHRRVVVRAGHSYLAHNRVHRARKRAET